MKPTTEQQRSLKKYLRKNLRYSETYAEFYDHILTAIESISGISFEDAVNRVIFNDFGGGDGMVEIENRYRKQTFKEMQRRYWRYLTDCLKLPSIVILAISSIVVYYLVKQPGLNYTWVLLSVMSMACIPSVLNGVRYIRAGFFFGDIKRSVKDDGFTWLKYLPGGVFFFMMIFHSSYIEYTPINFFKYANPIVITTISIAYALHVITFYRIFRDEYKVDFVDK